MIILDTDILSMFAKIGENVEVNVRVKVKVKVKVSDQ